MKAWRAPSVRKVLDNTGLYEAWFEELPKPAHHCVPVIGVCGSWT